jgi:PDZ domain-containing secreted protein
MDRDRLIALILLFFEEVTKYYGSTTEITEGIVSDIENIDANLTTWNLSEFVLIRSAYRKTGNKFMLEGKGLYYEMAAEKIVALNELGRNNFEFIEQYSDTVFRITRLKFQYRY